MRRWRGPSDSRFNREARDVAFARAAIGEAERKRREALVVTPPDQGGVERRAADRFKSLCCTGNDPACPTHGVAASNARENDYWRRAGGHPDAGYVDVPDVDSCAWCGAPLDCDPESSYPYCSTQCAISAEVDE